MHSLRHTLDSIHSVFEPFCMVAEGAFTPAMFTQGLAQQFVCILNKVSAHQNCSSGIFLDDAILHANGAQCSLLHETAAWLMQWLKTSPLPLQCAAGLNGNLCEPGDFHMLLRACISSCCQLAHLMPFSMVQARQSLKPQP